MEKARCNTELYSNLRAPLNNVKPSNFWGSHQTGRPLFYYTAMYMSPGISQTVAGIYPYSSLKREVSEDERFKMMYSSLKRGIFKDKGLKMKCSSLKRGVSEDEGFLGGRKTHHKKGSSQTTTPLFVYIGKTTVIYFFFRDIR